mgnify:CR=1 FL=1|jgi:prepilin-type cleavage/methylation N-terminal domain protein
MKINKKGFTLIELLVVISILVILLTLAYLGVSQYMKQARDAVYEDFEKNITNGVTNYLIDHSGSIPSVGESLVVDVEKLVCEGYIEDLEDPRESSKTCNLESYAIVKRNNDTNYNMDIEYSACLKCSNYKSPACSNPISGIKRLKASIDCEVK